MLSMFRSALRFFLQSLELARQAGLRRGAHAIDEQNSIQMVDLVLNGARQKPRRLNFNRFALQILRPHRDRFRTVDLAGDLWKTKATFRACFGFVAELKLRID